MAEQRISTGTLAHQLQTLAATGTTSAANLGAIHATHVLQTKVTGSPSAVSVVLEGSLDGSAWYTLATSTSTTGDAQFAVDKPALFLRANLGTLTGGTAPTVTALVGSA